MMARTHICWFFLITTSLLVSLSASTHVATSAIRLLDAWRSHQSDVAARGLSSDFRVHDHLSSMVRVHQHKVLVRLYLANDRTHDEVVELVTNLAGTVHLIPADAPRRVLAWLPLDSLESFAEGRHSSLVSHLLPAEPPIRRTGGVNSQATEAVNALGGQSNLFTGAGQKIGILSDSFDTTPSIGGGMAASIASGDLPPASRINILRDQPDGTDEGRAMAELIYDLAPGVDFLFYAPTSREDMDLGITQLRNVGATIIVDDLFFFSEFIFKDGDLAQAAEAAVQAGVPYLSAAGNDADHGFDATWNPMAVTLVDADPNSPFLPFPAVELLCHQFSPGIFLTATTTATRLGLYFAQTTPATVNMFLIDVDSSNESQFLFADLQDNTGADPFDVVDISHDRWGICIWARNARNLALGTRLKVLPLNAFDFAVADSSGPTLVGHSAAPNVISVAAAPFFRSCRGSLPALQADCPSTGPQVEDFTSLGGQIITFDAIGNPITPIIRLKPDLTGIDGIDTTFFGGGDLAPDPKTADDGITSVTIDTNAFPNFFGTSAAVSVVTAIVAMMKEQNPQLTPSQLLNILQSTATDIHTDFKGRSGITNGFDLWSGSGLVNAAAAMNAASPAVSPPFNGLIPITSNQFMSSGSCGNLTVVDVICVGLTRVQCGSSRQFECCRWLKVPRGGRRRRSRCAYNCKQWTDEDLCNSDVNCVWSRKSNGNGNTCRRSRAWKNLNQ